MSRSRIPARESELVVLVENGDGSVMSEADTEIRREWLNRAEMRYAISHVGTPLRALDFAGSGRGTGSLDDLAGASVYVCTKQDVSNGSIAMSSGTPGALFADVRLITIDSRWDDVAELRSTEATGTGVFAKRAFRQGELVFVLTGLATSKRTRMTVQVGRDRHIEPSVLCAHVNHSCDPCAGIRDNASGTYDVIAMRQIAVGEEITIDYDTFESEIVSDDLRSCACGTALCREKAIGYDSLPIERRECYGEFIAAHLLQPRD